LKVLFINTYHYRRAGAEVHALDLAEQLRRRGHEVRFFSMHHQENLDSPDADYWVPEIDFRSMHAAKNPVNAVQVLSRAIYSTDARTSLARMLSTWRPDVAHLHNLHAHLTPSVIGILRSRAIPVVWTLHDYKLLCPNTTFVSHDEVCERCKGSRFWQCTLRKCKKDSRTASLVATLEAEAHRLLRIPSRVARFIAPSEFLRQKFIEYGWPSEKFVHIPNFNNQPLVRGVTSLSESRVLYSGQLVRTKGVMTLLEAVRQSPGVTLDLAGEGPLRAEIEAEIASWGTSSAKVHLHGHVGAIDLARLIEGSRLVVVPSEWYENSPYAVIEAFARARPVVASRIGGLPELVVDGFNGITVTPGSPREIAAAIKRLLDEPELWLLLAKGALESAAARGATDYVNRLEKVYSAARNSIES
jgi:glycosyltransferase involved in cell wall biosynthesis